MKPVLLLCVCFALILSGCDSIVPEIGGEGQPCSTKGTCKEGLVCKDGVCCRPNCKGKECGDDGCGGNCGAGCIRSNATAACIIGECRIESCNSLWGNCDDIDSNGCETPLDTLTNCGSCWNVCSLSHANESCSIGTCHIQSCDALWDDCNGLMSDGCEISLETLADCGSCGNTCSLANATDTCTAGICQIESCNSLWGDCDSTDSNGCEKPLNTLTDCGSCGTACSMANATASCAGGICQIASCDEGWGDCDGIDSNGCENSLDSLNDCGACGVTCDANEECINGICIAWIQIPGGTFMMGSDSGEAHELPVHQVTVPTFEMSKTEVTVSQYQSCVDASNCSSLSTGTYCNWQVSGREDHPVNCVDWHQAVDFCTWAGGRLPTEAEWEYAARSGGQDIDYPWGDQTATCQYAVMYEGGNGCGQDRTWSVCSKIAGNTTQGLCDMAGNVWEWVQDYYHDSYNEAPSDGTAWESPSGDYRVLRGGSWLPNAGYLRASFRGWYYPGGGFDSFGFRCAR